MVGSCEFSRGEELVPVVLVVVAEHSDVCLKFLVDTLCLPISLGVVCSQCCGLDSKEVVQLAHEACNEHGAAVMEPLQG